MIYFDNSATTLIKPQKVFENFQRFTKNCANAGRSGHKPSMNSSNVIFNTRQAICDFFDFDNLENVIFTYNATYALNIAIKGIILENCTVLTSGFEHNSTIRPLMSMSNVNLEIIDSKLYDSEEFLRNFKEKITIDTKYAVINHVSNVFGYILPIKEIDEICHQNGIKLILDASQSAGILDIKISDFKSLVAMCMPSHKGLYGVMGVGILILKDGIQKSIIEGGTGSVSDSMYQPDFLPDMLESGTPNAPAIGVLSYGLEYLSKIKNVQKDLFDIAKYTANKLDKIDDTKVFFSDDINLQTGVISFLNENIDNEELSQKLSQFNICTRAGFHCAPLAHKSANTNGTIRVSFSTFNNINEVENFLYYYKKIIKS